MAITQQQRQKQIFAAEDWQVLYTAFTQVNFNAYDFNSIRQAMVTYIRLNYPEDFNDWIESSEFVAIIDLISYLGTSIAFRMDLNTRENFLDTAQRRESIFRLAQMLNYQPQRCLTSLGLLKITQIVTTQSVYDSSGNNLANVPINWYDQNNPDWYEQFIVVLNATLYGGSQFGNPSESGTVGGIQTDLYAMNNTVIPTSVIPFGASVGGNSMRFELINPDLIPDGTVASQLGQTGYFIERPPNPLNNWYIIYKSDGNGYRSANTGFFLTFKEGNMNKSDFQLDLPIANRVIDINANSINQTDVWVESIDSTGAVQNVWTQVPSVNGFNVIYNSVDNNVRNIFSVITRDNNGQDAVSIRFADGNFGNVPVGLLRVWYRTSNGLQYQIRPTDITNRSFTFSYNDSLNNTYSVAFNTSLQYTVANSQGPETNAQIALNAPAVYYTQDRMVNGEDYNLYPLQSSQALKVKAVNRTYSGQSRYLDINDPTGAYQNTNILADDGMIYSEQLQNRQVVTITNSLTSNMLVANYIQPMVNGTGGLTNTATELRDFFYASYPRQASNNITWNAYGSSVASATGTLYREINPVSLGSYAPYGDPSAYITSGALLNFASSGWVSVSSIIGEGDNLSVSGLTSLGAPLVSLSGPVTNNDVIISIFPAFRTTFTTSELALIAGAASTNQTFGIRYDPLAQAWYIITNDNLDRSGAFSLNFAGNTSSTGIDASWLVQCIYNGSNWLILTRAQRYVVESIQEARFFFANTTKIIDPTTNNAVYDSINILGINSVPGGASALGKNYLWKIKNQYIYPDGYAEPNSVQVTFWDSMQPGLPDNPDQFTTIVNPPGTSGRMIFWQVGLTTDGYNYYYPINLASAQIFVNTSNLPAASSSFWQSYGLAFVQSNNKFYQLSGTTITDVSSNYKARIGRNNLTFMWKHYAPYDQRIDPSITNIIDMYILTSNYDTALRNWIMIGGNSSTEPTPPNTNELSATFSYFEQFKMMTDQIIWHPVSYKLLFGSQADPSLQVVFKVVKTYGSTYSDNEVKSLVKSQIDAYFALSNWDFGQSFYFTELATYIHLNLATIVASVVIVPKNAQAVFGDLFEIDCDPDEIFISCATVSDIQLVTSLSETQLGISSNG